MIARARACIAFATIALSVSPTAQTLVARMNCGGGEVSAPDGLTPFSADAPYIAGVQGGYEGGTSLMPTSGNQVGPLDDPFGAVQATARERATAYRFELPNGDYAVRLHMAEIAPEVHGPNLRRFDVLVEDERVLADVDPAGLLGNRYGGSLVVRGTVADGRLDVRLLHLDGKTLLSGIEVFALSGAIVAPERPVNLTAKPGHGRTILKWTPDPSPTLSGILVEWAPSPDGPWTPLATLPAQPARFHDTSAPAGVERHYRVTALDLDGVAGAPSASVSAGAHLDNASSVLTLRLNIAPADLAFLDEFVLDDELGDVEVPATLELDGETQPVEVRYRGAGSRNAPKKGWKIKFPKASPFQGREELNLKANFLDESIIKERSLRALFEAVAHPVSRQRWVRLEINGVDRGVFNEIEQVDDLYLAARGRDAGGSIFKCRDGLVPLATPEDYVGQYDLQTSAAELTEIIAFIEVLNEPTTTIPELLDVFDMEGFLDYLAVVFFAGDGDQFVRNFHLVFDHDLQRWEWVTWDNDRSLFDPEFPIDPATCGCEITNAMHGFVLSRDALRWRLVEKIQALMLGPASSAQFTPHIQSQHDAIALDALADAEKYGWEIDAPFLAGPAELEAFVSARIAWLGPEASAFQPPAPPTTVWINELSARGVSTALDETGAAEDWLELVVAPGSPTVDLSGYSLTDDLSEPGKWQLPAGTTLSAGQHLLVWCDNDADDGPLHANFKLSGGGEELGLFDDHGLLLDAVHFGPQRAELSHGRSTDAGPFFVDLATPTPGAANTTAGNLPPWVAAAPHTPNVPGSQQVVEVGASIWDSDTVRAATLFWRVDGGAFASSAMQPAGPARWAADVPTLPDGSLVEYFITATDDGGASGSFPDDAPASLAGYTVVDPSPGDVRITEFMADNDSTVADESGQFDDWFELANVGTISVDVGGWTLTDDLLDPFQWPLPDGLVLSPGERVLVWADDDADDGPLHANFKLSSSGEELGLFDARGDLVDAVSFGAQSSDVSQLRLPDTTPAGQLAPLWFATPDPSPASANVPAPGGALRYHTLGAAPVLTLARVSGGGLPDLLVLQTNNGLANESAALVFGLTLLDANVPPFGTLLLLPLAGFTPTFVLDAAGSGEMVINLPANPALNGLPLACQAYTAGVGLSNGVLVTLGE